MKLNLLREHFIYKANKNSWIPKKSFTTAEELINSIKFNPDEDKIYLCNYCDTLHKGRKPKGKK